MNTHTNHDLTGTELDDRLRTTFATMMPLLDAPSASGSRPGPHRNDDGAVEFRSDQFVDVAFDPDAPSSSPGRTPRLVLAAAACVALVAGLAVAQNIGTQTPAVSEQPAPATPDPAQPQPTPETAPNFEVAAPVATVDPICSDTSSTDGCAAFAELPVTDGASDFYIGPESLGTPVVAAPEDFESLLRCTTLDEAGTACAEIEGFAGVGSVTYSGSDDPEVTVDTSGGLPADALDVAIGTTFTDIAPDEYGASWGDLRSAQPDPISTSVRGHDAVRYSDSVHEYVVWNERPGVLVWVQVPARSVDDLLTIAEGVRQVPGPETIPWIVSISDDSIGSTFRAGSNDANSIVIGRLADGGECVGFGYIEGECSGQIGQQTFTRYFDGRAQIVGAASAGTATVRISQNGQTLVEAATRPIVGVETESLLFDEEITATGQVTVDWLDAAGQVLASTTVEIDDDFCQLACG